MCAQEKKPAKKEVLLDKKFVYEIFEFICLKNELFFVLTQIVSNLKGRTTVKHQYTANNIMNELKS